MKHLHRRDFLSLGARSLFGLSLRSAITGLPVAFLTRGDAHADSLNARIAILSSSSSGEPLNVCGPGTFEPGRDSFFDHPQARAVDLEEIGDYTVNGTLLTPSHLATSAELTLGEQAVRMARCFEVLEPSMLAHLVWFQYSTRANIHPQYSQVLTAYGELRGAEGRGAEQLPAAIAHETAPLLNTTMRDPFILGQGALTRLDHPSRITLRPRSKRWRTTSVERSVGPKISAYSMITSSMRRIGTFGATAPLDRGAS